MQIKYILLQNFKMQLKHLQTLKQTNKVKEDIKRLLKIIKEMEE